MPQVPRINANGWTIDGDSMTAWRDIGGVGYEMHASPCGNFIGWSECGHIWRADITDPTRPIVTDTEPCGVCSRPTLIGGEGVCYQCQCEAHESGAMDMDNDEWRGYVEPRRDFHASPCNTGDYLED